MHEQEVSGREQRQWKDFRETIAWRQNGIVGREKPGETLEWSLKRKDRSIRIAQLSFQS